MPEFTHGKPVVWSDLAVDVVTDKIPPGWYLGCGWPMEKYKDACEDWKILTSLDDDKKRCAALRFRLKGPVKDFMDLHRDILMEEYDAVEGEGDGRRTVRRRRPVTALRPPARLALRGRASASVVALHAGRRWNLFRLVRRQR